MPFIALAACLTFGVQAKPPVSAPDRSGEPVLRTILAWAQGLDNVHLVIGTESRDTGHEPMYPGERIDVWLSGSKFRVERSNYWGDGSYVVSDGKTVLSDSESEDSPAILTNAKGNLLATYADLKVSTEDLSPFFELMSGPSQLDELVEKTATIKLEPDQGDEKIVSFQHKKLGTERLYYHLVKGTPQLDRLEYDNLPEMKELFKANPDFADDPDPGMLTRHSFFIAADRPSLSLFDTRPPKGRGFRDNRASGHPSKPPHAPVRS